MEKQGYAFPSSITEVSGDLVLSKNQYEEFIDYINENYSYGAISKKHQFTGDVYIISSLKSKN